MGFFHGVRCSMKHSTGSGLVVWRNVSRKLPKHLEMGSIFRYTCTIMGNVAFQQYWYYISTTRFTVEWENKWKR